jgi:hypothetical protein
VKTEPNRRPTQADPRLRSARVVRHRLGVDRRQLDIRSTVGACRQDRGAGWLTTTAVIRKTSKANQLRESASVTVYSGGRNRK